MNNTEHQAGKASTLQVAKAVFWSFLGIRKKDDLDRDAKMIKPHQVVIGGLIGGVIFVLSILTLVKLVTS
ncbi:MULTISPECIES: DUF2970 domain-containing protein [Nitrosomonas]|jgi:hypothetical protein|uniref:Membrane protein n=1 Tax=Nitrosomonas communis TaxID=44574 RepID=A0A0F7KJF1_9PROT|nr:MULTISPECIES: DUF2970 domain-containing protein [Nitrosomonas]AKH39228.1 membrane protein [Nitrosomonas communis]TYP88695.1 Protein of unknown function (DUF2970) [Nitrosomonas communis]UVS61430.1 DUF2970 domain-containing protein [Nitrosomonas sp. PLL12]SDW53180.1 Protein of unknown function [Nitrosomonas communis]